MANNSTRINAISFLKFLFVSFIVVLHCFVPKADDGKVLFEGAYILCDFFFILQGYFLYEKGLRSDSEADCITYAKKIFLSFFPIILIQSILLLSIDILLKNHIGFNYLFGIISQLSFITVLTPIVHLQNGALWFLSAYLIGGFVCLFCLICFKNRFACISFLISFLIYNYIITTRQTIDVWHEIGIAGSPIAIFRAIAGCSLGIFAKYLSKFLPELKNNIYRILYGGGGIVYSNISMLYSSYSVGDFSCSSFCGCNNDCRKSRKYSSCKGF